MQSECKVVLFVVPGQRFAERFSCGNVSELLCYGRSDSDYRMPECVDQPGLELGGDLREGWFLWDKAETVFLWERRIINWFLI